MDSITDTAVAALLRADHTEGLLAVMADTSSGGTALSGGRITEGVLQVGDTVRRPENSSSEFVAALLRLLEEKHFDGVPRYLGGRLPLPR